MKIGIVGLGLIGGSLAKAYKEYSDNIVYGYDINKPVQDIALMSKTIDYVLDISTIPLCDCIFIALYPSATINYLKQNACFISKNTIVMDTCGTKRKVCEAGFKIASEYGFVFAGGHPMAGKQNSGFSQQCYFIQGCYMICGSDSINITCLKDKKIRTFLFSILRNDCIR